MALDATKNFAKGIVSTGYDDSAVSIALSSGHGARFPQPSTDGEFNLVWWDSSNYKDPSDDPKAEIVRCTARSTDTLTVTRAQESTSASTKNTGGATYTMALVMTSKMVDDIDSLKIGNLVEDTTPQLGGQLDVNGNAIGDGTLELLKFEETASAVNEITIKNAATGSAPEVKATGDDTNIDVKLTPKGTGIVKGELHTATFVLKDKDTSLAIGTGIGGDFRIPGNRAITVKSVGAYTDTASATGSNKLTIDINEAGTTILSTKITLDVGEKTSQTAATAPVISDASIAADAIITFDIDQVNETTPDKGLKVYIEFIYT